MSKLENVPLAIEWRTPVLEIYQVNVFSHAFYMYEPYYILPRDKFPHIDYDKHRQLKLYSNVYIRVLNTSKCVTNPNLAQMVIYDKAKTIKEFCVIDIGL